MARSECPRWLAYTISLAVSAAISAAFSVCFWRRKSRGLESRIRDLEISLKASLEKCAAERQGRIRAQQALRKALEEHGNEKSKSYSFPMTPIATVQSCFSTRNGTPRQPLLVPLARACLVLNPSRAPPDVLEGLAEYSHCWIIYVFHLNTDLEKLWKEPSRSKFKAKVRVPGLKGGKMGVLATRSPHRPCPIGLSIAKVEAVHGRVILLSGVDLVDGTPVLDIKPYLPYSDSIQGATVPKWVTVDSSLAISSVSFSRGFRITLTDCWVTAGKHSLYISPDEFEGLISQVLSWDIRSVSQRQRPHHALSKKESIGKHNLSSESEDDQEVQSYGFSEGNMIGSMDITYHLILEGIDVSYRIDSCSNVLVEKAMLTEDIRNTGNHSNDMMWSSELGC